MGNKAKGLIYYVLRIDGRTYFVKPFSKKPGSEAGKSRRGKGGITWYLCPRLVDGGIRRAKLVTWTKNTMGAQKATSTPSTKIKAPIRTEKPEMATLVIARKILTKSTLTVKMKI